MLTVFDYDRPPDWCKKEWLDGVEASGVFDIDGPYNAFLSGLLRGER